MIISFNLTMNFGMVNFLIGSFIDLCNWELPMKVHLGTQYTECPKYQQTLAARLADYFDQKMLYVHHIVARCVLVFEM